jgi:hypothetical protein
MVLRVELLLEGGHALDAAAEELLRFLLELLVEARGVAGVEALQAEVLAVVDEVLAGDAATRFGDFRVRGSASGVLSSGPNPLARGWCPVHSLVELTPNGGLP